MYNIIFSVVIVIIYIALLIWSKNVYKNIINPVSVYITMWLGFTFISCFGLWDMYIPKFETLSFILISTLSFSGVSFLTYIFARQNIKKDFYKQEGNDNKITKNITFKLMVINILALIWMSKFVSKMLPILLSGDWGLARFYYLNASTIHTIYTTREALVCQWVIFPVFYATSIYSAYLLSIKKTNYLIMTISTIGILSIVISTAGRNPLFKLVLFYVLAFTMNSVNKKKLWKKVKETNIIIKILVLIAIGILIYISSKRSLSSDSTVFQNVIYYFTGPIIYFDNIIQNPEKFGLYSNFLFGRATFGFISTPIEIVFSLLTGNDYAGADNIITSYVSFYEHFSPTIKGNAVSTSLYPFMKDFGYVGILVGPAIFAIIVNYVYAKANYSHKFNHQFWNCMGIYMLYIVFFSQWQYDLLFPQSFTIMIILYIFVGKRSFRIKFK